MNNLLASEINSKGFFAWDAWETRDRNTQTKNSTVSLQLLYLYLHNLKNCYSIHSIQLCLLDHFSIKFYMLHMKSVNNVLSFSSDSVHSGQSSAFEMSFFLVIFLVVHDFGRKCIFIWCNNLFIVFSAFPIALHEQKKKQNALQKSAVYSIIVI